MNYEIIAEEKIIRFNPDKITKKEIKTIQKLAEAFKYKLVPYVEKKEAKPEWTEKAIREFLEDKPEALAIYESKYNAPMMKDGKPVLLKNDSKDGKRKKGDPRVKGHVATLQWFKKRFPEYPNSDKENKNAK